MQIFEIEAEDGTIYEVEAEDEQSAFSFFDEAMATGSFFDEAVEPEPIPAGQSNSPVTEEAGPNWMDRNVAPALNSASAMMQNALDTGTMGAFAGLDALASGAGSYARDRLITGENPDMSFGDFVDQRNRQRNQLSSDNPRSSFLGTMAGGIYGGAKLANAATDVFPALANSVMSRIGTASALGAMENLGTNLGQGKIDDLSTAAKTAGVGAAAGAGGQGIAELLGPVLRYGAAKIGVGDASNQHAMGQLGKSIDKGGISKALNEGESAEALLRGAADNLSGGRHLGEADDLTRELYARASQRPGAVGNLRPTAARGAEALRELPSDTRSLLDDVLQSGNRGSQPGQDIIEERSRNIMREIFDTPTGANKAVMPKDRLIKSARTMRGPDGRQIFNQNTMTPTTRSTLDRFGGLVEGTGRKNSKGLSMQAMQKIKIDLDDTIASNWVASPTSKDKMDMRAMLALKNHVNDSIGKLDPRYKDAAQGFAGVRSVETARKSGFNMMKGTNTTAPIEEVATYMNGLSPSEVGAAREGAFDWLQGQVAQQPNYIKRIGQENPAILARLRTIFGDVDLDRLATQAESLATQRKQYEALAGSQQRGITTAFPGQHDLGVESMVDAMATGTMAIPGRGTPFAALRRAVSVGPEAFERNLIKLLQTDSPQAANELLDEIMKHYRAPQRYHEGRGRWRSHWLSVDRHNNGLGVTALLHN